MYYVNEQKAKRQCFHIFKSFPLNQDQKLVKKINTSTGLCVGVCVCVGGGGGGGGGGIFFLFFFEGGGVEKKRVLVGVLFLKVNSK